MLKVVETFSGIGAQAKALNNINCEYEILHTADWDINAIIAYDLIHNRNPQLEKYKEKSRQELLDDILKHSLSTDGKKETTKSVLSKLNMEVLKRLSVAIDRSKNLISVADIKGEDLPDDTNILTYSFPCQDLSKAGFWYGNKGGIDKNANNRSSMLWQIERILQERKRSHKNLPRFLLMENVRNIKSKEHSENFEKWKQSLVDLGYYNQVYELNAKNFGIPQNRTRVFMISFLVESNELLKTDLINYLSAPENDLELIRKKTLKLEKFLRTDYSNSQYKNEADESQPNYTPSRIAIGKNNDTLYDGIRYADIVPTITTKQDRHPNSGVIKYIPKAGKCDFRYLTPRECFLLMGFTDEDYEIIIRNNFKSKKNTEFFSQSKLIKMAGNSIVVNVLEEVFKLIIKINKEIYGDN